MSSMQCLSIIRVRKSRFAQVCLSILNDDPDLGGAWAPSLTVCQVGTNAPHLNE